MAFFQIKPKNFNNYRWVSLIAGTLIFTTLSWGFTWSLMVNPMIDIYGATDAYMAACYSGLTITGMIFTLIGGKVVNVLGSVKTNLISFVAYFVGMILCGITQNLVVWAFANVILMSWQQSVVYIAVANTASAGFPDHRGLALGVSTAGISLGGMFISPITQAVIDTFGFQSMFIVMGIGLTVMAVICIYLNPDVPEGFTPDGMEAEEDNEEGEKKEKRWMANPNFKQVGYVGMLKSGAFYLLFAVIILCVTGHMLLSYQMSYIAQDILGIPAMSAAFLVSGVAACGFASKILGGFIGDVIGRLRWLAIVTCCGTLFIGGLIFAGDHDITWFAVCCFGYCFCIGAVAGMTGAVTGDLFGSENFGGNFSVVYMAVLLASMFSPWLGVVGRSAAGGPDYQPVFMLCTAMCAVGAVLAIVLFIKYRNKTEFIPRKGNEELLEQQQQ